MSIQSLLFAPISRLSYYTFRFWGTETKRYEFNDIHIHLTNLLLHAIHSTISCYVFYAFNKMSMEQEGKVSYYRCDDTHSWNEPLGSGT